MIEVKFNYKGIDTTIQCNENDKMKDIINKYIIKTQNNEEKYYPFCYLYNGNRINEESTFKELANDIDNKSKKMNLLVYDKEEENNNEFIIKSKYIICPECKENSIP